MDTNKHFLARGLPALTIRSRYEPLPAIEKQKLFGAKRSTRAADNDYEHTQPDSVKESNISTYDIQVSMNGDEKCSQYYDGVGRCGLREIQKGLAQIPDSQRAFKARKYAIDRNYRD